MAGIQDLLDGVAQVVGGTAPDAVNRPRWFSGAQTADGTGISGLNGCYSAPISSVDNAPVAYVMPGRDQLINPRPDVLTYGTELRRHDCRLRLLVPGNDPETQIAVLTPFIDQVHTLMAAHQTLFGTATVYQVTVPEGDFVAVTIGNETYMAYQFIVAVYRNFQGRAYAS